MPSSHVKSGAAWLLLLSLSACKSFGGGGSTVPPGLRSQPPTVLSHTPLDSSSGVPLNEIASVTFSEAMSIATLNTSTFTLTSGAAANPVRGEVVVAGTRAVFWPTAHLATNSLITATITTGAKSATGVALAENHTWTFSTGDAVARGFPMHPDRAEAADLGISPLAANGLARVSVTTQAFSTPAQAAEWVFKADPAPSPSGHPSPAVSLQKVPFSVVAARQTHQSQAFGRAKVSLDGTRRLDSQTLQAASVEGPNIPSLSVLAGYK